MQVNLNLTLLIALSIFSGCTTMRSTPNRSGDINEELKQLETYYRPTLLTDYNKQKEGGPESKTITFRDEIVLGRVHAIDLHYGIFRQALTKESVSLNLGIDLAVIGMNAAGTLLPAKSTKAILAAMSGGFVGAKGTIDKDVFYDKTIPVLFSKMDALRKKRLVTIQTGLDLDTNKYPLLQALIDVEYYFNAGTIPGAIMEIIAKSGATLQKADEDLKGLIETKYALSGPTRPTRDSINRWLDSNLDTNVPLLRDWLHKQEPPVTLSPATWVDDTNTTAEELMRAIKELNIPE